MTLHRAGDLSFYSDLAGLSEADAFAKYLVPLRETEWVVYAKPPFGGPEAVLAYLSRYTSSCGNLEQPPDQRRCRDSRLPLEELSDQNKRPTARQWFARKP